MCGRGFSVVAVVEGASTIISRQNSSAETMLPKISELINHTKEIQQLSEAQKSRAAQIRESEKQLVDLDYVILDILKKNKSLIEELTSELEHSQ